MELITTSAGWWVQGQEDKREKKKVVILCDNVNVQLCTHQRNSRKSLCNYSQWHVRPNYNNVYDNWRRLSSNSVKPPNPQPTWYCSSPNLNIQAGGPSATSNITQMISLCRLYMELSCRITLTGRYSKMCMCQFVIAGVCVCVCDLCPCPEAVIFKEKVHVHTHMLTLKHT